MAVSIEAWNPVDTSLAVSLPNNAALFYSCIIQKQAQHQFGFVKDNEFGRADLDCGG